MRRWLAAMVVLAAACAPTASPPAQPTDVTAGASESGATAVPAALDWTVADLGGGQIVGGDLAGKDVVLWFWAPW